MILPPKLLSTFVSLLVLVTHCDCLGFGNVCSSYAAHSEAGTPDGDSDEKKTQKNETEVKSINVESVLRYSERDGKYHAAIYLPVLEAGAKRRIVIDLFNTSAEELSFDDIELHSSSLKFNSDSKGIAPHSKGRFQLTLSVPKRDERTRQMTSVKFRSKKTGKVAVDLTITYRMSDMFIVSLDSLDFRIRKGDGISTQLVEYQVFPPLTDQELELSVSENLRDLPIKRRAIDRRYYIEVSVNELAVSEAGISGEVMLKRRGATDTDGFVLHVIRESDISLAPRSLRFYKTNDQWEAKAVIRTRPMQLTANHRGEVSAETDVDSKKDSVPKRPSVQVWVGGEAATVHITQIGKTCVFRLKIVSDRPENLEGDSADLKWKIESGKDSMEVEAKAAFRD